MGLSNFVITLLLALLFRTHINTHPLSRNNVQRESATHESLDPWIYYPPGTHDHKARRNYPEYNLSFVDYGDAEHEDDTTFEPNVPFEECTFKYVCNREKGVEIYGMV